MAVPEVNQFYKQVLTHVFFGRSISVSGFVAFNDKGVAISELRGMWKATVGIHLRHCSEICLKGLEKPHISKNFQLLCNRPVTSLPYAVPLNKSCIFVLNTNLHNFLYPNSVGYCNAPVWKLVYFLYIINVHYEKHFSET